MLKDLLVKNGFTEDQCKTIIDNINESQDYVPKGTFNAELDKNKQLKADIATRDAQLKDLSEKAGDNAALKADIEILQAENAKAKKDYADGLKRMQKDIALASKYGESVYNIDDIKRSFNYEKLTLNEKGEIIDGFEEQDKEIREKCPHYFKPANGGQKTPNSILGTPPAAGSNPGQPNLTDEQKNRQASIDIVKAIRGIK